MVIAVTRQGELAGGPLVAIIRRCIVEGFAFFLRDLARCIGG